MVLGHSLKKHLKLAWTEVLKLQQALLFNAQEIKHIVDAI
jgi:hypothetical protein